MTAPMAMTVRGPVPAEELGVVLPHEHLLVDARVYWRPPDDPEQLEIAEAPVEMRSIGWLRRNPYLVRDNACLTDKELCIREVEEFTKLGGGTIVDVTLDDIGRDPALMVEVSERTGLHIVAGCGHYVAIAHPASLDDEPVAEVARRMIRDLTVGIGDTGVRAGIIGEIGTGDPLHPREEKVLRAAALAQAHTGAAITLHLTPPTRRAHETLDILEAAGSDLTRVVVGHLDESIDETLDYHRSIADRGCYLEYDDCGYEMYFPSLAGGPHFWLPSDRDRARAVATLCETGYQRQILLSHDVCNKTYLLAYGGFGYGHILRNLVTNIQQFGASDEAIDDILRKNPQRMLSGG